MVQGAFILRVVKKTSQKVPTYLPTWWGGVINPVLALAENGPFSSNIAWWFSSSQTAKWSESPHSDLGWEQPTHLWAKDASVLRGQSGRPSR